LAMTAFSGRSFDTKKGSRSIDARLRRAASMDIRSTDPTSPTDRNRSSIAFEASAIRDLNRTSAVSNRTAANEVLHCESAIEFICLTQAASGIAWDSSLGGYTQTLRPYSVFRYGLIAAISVIYVEIAFGLRHL
jgi:hypothetical protein